MPSHTEQVIPTTVFTTPHGLPVAWEINLDLPDSDPVAHAIRGWGHRGSFTPASIWVSRSEVMPPGPLPATITIEVRGIRSDPTSDVAPIELELPWVFAVHLARTIVKAARSLDHSTLDAIAELLDGKEWSDPFIHPIAALLRLAGRDVHDGPESGAGDRPEHVLCLFCQQQAPAATAHPYMGGWVGECCWDKRLRSSQ
jgi:hypothetical protein